MPSGPILSAGNNALCDSASNGTPRSPLKVAIGRTSKTVTSPLPFAAKAHCEEIRP
jgi:hypothetical protein